MGWFDMRDDEKAVDSWREMLDEIDRLMRWEPGGKCGIRATWKYKNDIQVRYYKDTDDFMPEGNPCIFAYLLTGSPTLNAQGSDLMFSIGKKGDYWTFEMCDNTIPVAMDTLVRGLERAWERENSRRMKAKFEIMEE